MKSPVITELFSRSQLSHTPHPVVSPAEIKTRRKAYEMRISVQGWTLDQAVQPAATLEMTRLYCIISCIFVSLRPNLGGLVVGGGTLVKIRPCHSAIFSITANLKVACKALNQ